MTAGAGGRGGGRDLPRLALIVLVALLLAWGAMVSAAARLADAGAPQLALLLDQPVPRIEAARAQRDPDPARLKRMLRHGPLDSEAMAAVAEAERAAGRNRRAVLAMEEALRRNPRSRPARLWLLMHYLQAGRGAEAIAQIDRLMLLVPSWRQQWLTSLALAAEAPEAEPALLAALARNPSWRADFFRTLPRAGVAPARMEMLLVAVARGSAGAAIGERDAVLQAYMEAGDISGARALLNRLGVRDLVFDPEFSGAAGMRALAWKLSDEASGTAEIRDGRLEVLLLDGKPAVLARQNLLLPPGNYRLGTHVAAGDGSGAAGSLSWSVECRRRPLATLEVAAEGAARQDFVVPPECARQTLILRSRASEFTDRESVALEWVRIEPIG